MRGRLHPYSHYWHFGCWWQQMKRKIEIVIEEEPAEEELETETTAARSEETEPGDSVTVE